MIKTSSKTRKLHRYFKLSLLIILILPFIVKYDAYHQIEAFTITSVKTKKDEHIIKDVPNYQQYPYAPNACEAYALTIALHAKGYALDYNPYEISQMVPYTDEFNPHLGYVGNQYVDDSMVATIYPDALIDLAKKFAPDSYNATGFDLNILKYEIKNEHPVLIWGTLNYFEDANFYNYSFGKEPDNGHTVVMYGYSDNELFISDSIYGYYKVDEAKLDKVYKSRGSMALVIK